MNVFCYIESFCYVFNILEVKLQLVAVLIYKTFFNLVIYWLPAIQI